MKIQFKSTIPNTISKITIKKPKSANKAPNCISNSKAPSHKNSKITPETLKVHTHLIQISFRTPLHPPKKGANNCCALPYSSN